jgi:DNA-binding NarL/FixJ family response regulator
MITVRILIADDHAIVRQGLKALLEREGFNVVAEAADGREAIQFAVTHAPDLAVLDVVMPGVTGIQAARDICRDQPRIKVLLISMHADQRYVIEALRAGATGYLLKDHDILELKRAIMQVARGGTYLSQGVALSVLKETQPLTTREQQVLRLIAEGNSTKEIAAVLGLSVKTAESHRARIMDKLQMRDTASLVRYAIRHGMIKA